MMEIKGETNEVLHELVLMCYSDDGSAKAVALKKISKLESWLPENITSYKMVVMYRPVNVAGFVIKRNGEDVDPEKEYKKILDELKAAKQQ